MKEIWKTILDYPDYNISNYGRVKRLKYHYKRTEHDLKPDISNWVMSDLLYAKIVNRKNFQLIDWLQFIFSIIQTNYQKLIIKMEIN